MTRVYLIHGLGADKRFFKYIKLPEGFEKIAIDTVPSNDNDTLKEYAQRIISQHDISKDDIVLGDSLGGMIAVEIAKLVTLKKVILTSTIKTDIEAPFYFRIFRKLPVYQLTPAKLINKIAGFVEPILKKLKMADADLLRSMLEKSSPQFLKWGAQAALHWRNDIIPPNLYHIIGDKDLVFPYKNIQNPTAVIKGGTHIMVFDKADEINKILAEILQKS